eukprot:c5393_g1_i1.p1 GENE.c5393_g1_i1~~c5393_g1_i1.p1  ORF type:complete len:282 (+),score=55.86 c5393_g1_i1:66-911(+)
MGFDVFVRCDDASNLVSIHERSTIADVRHALRQRTQSCLWNTAVFEYGGLVLDDTSALVECGIGQESTIHVSIGRLLGGMPATAGRVKMPANNRMYSSAALQTTAIWRESIGYDPHAPQETKAPDEAFESMKAMMSNAKVTLKSMNKDSKRGACKKCGLVGHLTYQCMNSIKVGAEEEEDVSSTSSEDSDEPPRRASPPPRRRDGEDKPRDKDEKKKSSSKDKEKHKHKHKHHHKKRSRDSSDDDEDRHKSHRKHKSHDKPDKHDRHDKKDRHKSDKSRDD